MQSSFGLLLNFGSHHEDGDAWGCSGTPKVEQMQSPSTCTVAKRGHAITKLSPVSLPPSQQTTESRTKRNKSCRRSWSSVSPLPATYQIPPDQTESSRGKHGARLSCGCQSLFHSRLALAMLHLLD